MDVGNTILMIVCSYIVTVFLTQSKLLLSVRTWLWRRNHNLGATTMCHMCVGFWVSIVVCYYYKDYQIFPLIWGGSYILSQLERRS